MHRFMFHALVASMIARAALTLTSCDGGGGGTSQASTTVMMGAAGGQAISPDGRLVLDVPPGALAANMMITITTLAAGEGSAALQALTPDFAWDLGPDGLQFAMPVAVTVDLPFPATAVAGNIDVGIPGMTLISGGVVEFPASVTSTLDMAAGTLVAQRPLRFREIFCFSGL